MIVGATAIAAVSLFLFEPERAVVSCLLGWAMLAIAVIDAENFIIPDVLSLPSIPAGLIATRLLDDPNSEYGLLLEHCAAAVVGFIVLYAVKQAYLLWRKREGLGLGDVKLMAAAGAWTGLEGMSHVLLLACVLAISYVAVLNLRNLRAINGTTALPFGVFLGPSIWVIWCVNSLAAGAAVGRLLTPY
jgi:leader peptidase (prepilin peptidase)/N-methyltransferase